jgi:hypothetical protein
VTVDDIMSFTVSETIMDIAAIQSSFSTFTPSSSSSSSSSTPVPPDTYTDPGEYPPILPLLLSWKKLVESLNSRYEVQDSAYPVLTPEETSVRKQINAFVCTPASVSGVEGEIGSGSGSGRMGGPCTAEHETVVNSDKLSEV